MHWQKQTLSKPHCAEHLLFVPAGHAALNWASGPAHIVWMQASQM
jgi:hypothetical protein